MDLSAFALDLDEPGRVREFKGLWLWLEGLSTQTYYYQGVKPSQKHVSVNRVYPKYATWRFSGLKKSFLDKVVVPVINKVPGVKWRYTHTKGRLWLKVPMTIQESNTFARWVGRDWYRERGEFHR